MDFAAVPLPALEAVALQLRPRDVFYWMQSCVVFVRTVVNGRMLATFLLSCTMDSLLPSAVAMCGSTAVADKLITLARNGRVVISGSTILHMLSDGAWTAGDVDVFCPSDQYENVAAEISSVAGTETNTSSGDGPYMYMRHISFVQHWTRSTSCAKIDLIVARQGVPIFNILQTFDIASCRSHYGLRGFHIQCPHDAFAQRSQYGRAQTVLLQAVAEYARDKPLHPNNMRAAPSAIVDAIAATGVAIPSSYYVWRWIRRLLERIRKYESRGLEIRIDGVDVSAIY